jgi:hypothetical protein
MEHRSPKLVLTLSAVPSKHAEHTRQRLMCALSMGIKNVVRTLSIHISFSLHNSKTVKFGKVPSKHAELTRKELICALSVRVRN